MCSRVCACVCLEVKNIWQAIYTLLNMTRRASLINVSIARGIFPAITLDTKTCTTYINYIYLYSLFSLLLACAFCKLENGWMGAGEAA